MRKKNFSIQEEEARTQQFLDKVFKMKFYLFQLTQYKQASNNIKEKNKQTVHKLEWNKEYQRLGR
jgi:hypothetical protein